MKTLSMLALAGTALMASVAGADPQVFRAAGANPADIQVTVDAFRAAISLGGANNGNGNAFTIGRREINWDGGANTLVATPLAGNFFNVTARRGADCTTPGTGFLQSARIPTEPGNTALRYGDVDPSYNTQFKAFSEQRLFASLGSPIVDVTMFTPADPTRPGTVNGFGVVFTDVDTATSTKIEYYDSNDRLLYTAYAQAADSGLSFVGVRFDPGVRVRRVRIYSGTEAIGAGVTDSTARDVVAMDDFVYSEPLPPICVADVDNGLATGEPDLGVNIDDLLFYLDAYAAGSYVGDVDDGTGTGNRDGGVTYDDLLYFLVRYEAGC
jgi:hypothetical protein